MKMSNDLKEPFDGPVGKREKKVKQPKVRTHMYITQDCISKVDAKASELGIDRSPCVQMLLTYALNNIKNDTLLLSDSIRKKK